MFGDDERPGRDYGDDIIVERGEILNGAGRQEAARPRAALLLLRFYKVSPQLVPVPYRLATPPGGSTSTSDRSAAAQLSGKS